MKALIVSDLHTEFGIDLSLVELWRKTSDNYDIVIVAGDVANSMAKAQDFLSRAFPEKTVIYVPGNHEYYGNDIWEEYIKAFPSAGGHGSLTKNVRLLHRGDFLKYGSIYFVGATLWTDFNLYGNPRTAMEYADNNMSDFHLIKYNGQRFTPQMAKNEHEAEIEFIDKNTKVWSGYKLVIVTHHCPHRNSIHSSYFHNPLNPAFCSDLDHKIKEWNADLMVHGHTHFPFDYKVHNTRIVCNPFGYPHERYRFDPLKIVEF